MQQAIRAGEPIPERIANAPELISGLEVFLTAFFELDSERTHGLALTPIPWTSINAYANAYSFCGQQKEDLFYFLRRMDNAHLEELDKTRTK